MAGKLKAIVSQISVAGDEWRESVENMAAVESAPGLLSRRDRGNFYALIEAAGDPYGIDLLYSSMMDAAKAAYFGARGSVTLGLRDAVHAANKVLFQENLESPRELRRIAGMSCVVLKHDDVYIGQAGPALVYVLSGTSEQRFPAESPWLDTPADQEVEGPNAVPLGVRKEVPVELFHSRVQAGDRILLASSNLMPLFERVDIIKALGEDPQKGIEDLVTYAGVDDASIMALDLVPAEAPESETAAAPRIFFRREEPAPRPREAVEETTAEMTADRRPPTAGRFTAVSRPLTRDAVARSATAVGGRLSAIARSAAGLLAILAQGLASLLQRTLPEHEGAPVARGLGTRRVLAGIALTIPLIVAVVVFAIYWQARGSKEARFKLSMEQAWEQREAALSTTDKPAIRAALREAQRSVESALLLRPDDTEALDLRGEIQTRLDQVNAVARLHRVAPLVEFKESESRPQRVLLHETSVYVLDRGGGKVYRYSLNETRDGLADPTAQVIFSKGEEREGTVIGEMVDVTLLNAADLLQTDTVLLLDRSNNLLRYDPTGEVTALKVAEVDQWQFPTLISTFNGNFYLLDRDPSRIIKYVPAAAGYSAPPVDWLSEETSVDLSTAVDMAIDGSIYVLLADGAVLRFREGVQEEFEQTDIDVPISSAAALYATPLTRYLYVADTSNKRIVQFSKDGHFERQFLPPAESEAFAQLQSIAVDELTGKIYALSGNKLWVASMPQVGE